MEDKIESLEEVILQLNKVAMNYLGLENFKKAKLLLQRAEGLINMPQPKGVVTNKLKLIAITYNNLGCFYKKKKQYKTSLEYLKRALSIEKQRGVQGVSLASSYLNICAVLSAQKKHEEAFNFAQQALKELSQNSQNTQEDLTTHVITFHNAGVELEYMKKLDESITYFQRGYELALRSLGRQHPLTRSVEQVYLSAVNRSSNLSTLHLKRHHLRYRKKVSTIARHTSTKLPGIASNPTRRSSSVRNYATDPRRVCVT